MNTTAVNKPTPFDKNSRTTPCGTFWGILALHTEQAGNQGGERQDGMAACRCWDSAAFIIKPNKGLGEGGGRTARAALQGAPKHAAQLPATYILLHLQPSSFRSGRCSTAAKASAAAALCKQGMHAVHAPNGCVYFTCVTQVKQTRQHPCYKWRFTT